MANPWLTPWLTLGYPQDYPLGYPKDFFPSYPQNYTLGYSLAHPWATFELPHPTNQDTPQCTVRTTPWQPIRLPS